MDYRRRRAGKAIREVVMVASTSFAGEARSERPQLPERVEAAIRSKQDRSEMFIGWIQLAVITTFAVLYFIAPKPAGAAGYITVAAIGVYFVLTVARLLISYSFSMPAWMLALSVVFDMALLFALIWSFHIQYDQPPSFYLKAPTLLYVFIFIALRALRFEAGFVILAGGLAAAGWLFMAAYAVYATGPEMITRDYVYYMTSNGILIGAEFDKIASILVVTAILATAVIRSRRLLERTVAEGFAVQDLSRFFAPEIAKRIVAQGSDIVAGAGEARDAAVLYVDVRNFTRLAQKLPPDAVMQILAEFQACLVPVIRRHGGVVDKFLGDGIMATFGAAAPSETYAADALSAMDDLMAEARRWSIGAQEGGGVPLRVNGGVAAGRIIFGAVGDRSRLEYTVIGDAANLSAKLVKHNKALGSEALTTAETYALALAQGYRPPKARTTVAESAVASVAEPMDVVIVA
jgi:adenylate cyclase